MNFGRSSPSKHKAWLCIKLTGWSVTKLLNVSLCWQPPISPHQVQPCQKCQLESLTIHWHPCHMKAGDRRSYCHWGGAVNSHQPLWLLLPLRKDAMTRSAFGTVTGAEHGATRSIFGFSSRSLSRSNRWLLQPAPAGLLWAGTAMWKEPLTPDPNIARESKTGVAENDFTSDEEFEVGSGKTKEK